MGGYPRLPGGARVLDASNELMSTPGSNPTEEIEEAMLCWRPLSSLLEELAAEMEGRRGGILGLAGSLVIFAEMTGGTAGVAAGEGVKDVGGL